MITVLAVVSESAGSFTMPLVAIAIVLAFVFVGVTVASRYKRVAPNVIGVFYGRKHKVRDGQGAVVERGYRTVSGGGSILWPIFERYQEMSMAAFQVVVRETNIPSAKNVGVDIGGVATCRISNLPEDQNNAVSAFLGKNPEQISEFVEQILKGHIRSIIGKLTVEELLRDRATFNQKVVEESAEEFRKLGLQIVTLVIQEVKDAHGYIDALGRKEIAAAMRDANIQVAEAEKETAVKTSGAAREAAEAKAQNEAKILEAQRALALQVAENKRLVDGKNAEAALAGQLVSAQQQEKLAIAEASRDKASAEAKIGVQESERKRKEKELEATVIVTAEANRKATLIKADGDKQAAEFQAQTAAITAEGARKAAVTTGQGEAERTKLKANAEAEATKATMGATAEGNQKIALAAAEGQKAALLATAEGERARLLAIAEGKEKGLLAEASGTAALALALKELSEQGKLMLILDRLPLLITNGGTALAAIAKEVFGPLGEGMGAIKNISIVDMGGNGDGSATSKIGGMIPNMVGEFFMKAKAQGIDVSPLLKFLKMDPTALVSMLGGVAGLDEKKAE